MEKDRSASDIEIVPSALSFLPVNGKTSWPLCDWQLILTRLTKSMRRKKSINKG